MNISLVNNLLLMIFLVVFLMSFYVWKAAFKNPLNISFGIFSFLAGCWVLLNYLWGYYQTSHLLLAFTYLISPAMIISMFTWVNYLFRKNLPTWLSLSVIIASIINFLFVVLEITQIRQLISSVESRTKFTTGPIFSLFTAYFFLIILGFIFYFFWEYKKANQGLKKSLNVIATGIILTIFIASTVSFILPAFGYVELAIFDAPSIIFFVAFSAYAILRLELFNIKTVVIEISAYLIMILSFIILFVVKEDVNLAAKIILMALFVYGGYTLIKSVKTELSQQEDLKKLAENLQLANKQLEEVDALKTEFISMASHELLTPISAINGYLSMIYDEKLVKIEDERAKKYLNQVYGSSKRLAKLVAALLNVSRIEQGRLLIEKSDVMLNELIENVIAELKLKAAEKKHTLKTNFGSLPETQSYADPDKIKEILINLCGNSIKYTPDGGEIEVGFTKQKTKEVEKEHEEMKKILIKNEDAPDSSLQNAIDENLRQLVGNEQIVIYIKDNGLGLSDDDIAHLFKKFSRVGDYTTQKVQGTGLGLYLSKALTEMQHGRIWVKSDGIGKGSTFFFSLPESSQREEIKKLDSKVKVAKDAKPLAKLE
jgi:signal transduction histidine kinase